MWIRRLWCHTSSFLSLNFISISKQSFYSRDCTVRDRIFCLWTLGWLWMTNISQNTVGQATTRWYVVLADRGFESLGMMQAKLHFPAFTKGKTQLSAMKVMETTTIANVCIYVQRVIGKVRQKYSKYSAYPQCHQERWRRVPRNLLWCLL